MRTVFAGCADSGQFSKENSPLKTRHKHGANGSQGHVELGKENDNQISGIKGIGIKEAQL